MVTMTATQARTFNGYSVGNAIKVKTALACGCEPYQDVFTYRRWQAMGYQVRRGEHAIHLPLVKVVENENKETGETKTRKVLASSAVFCRHQVDAVGAAAPIPAEPLMKGAPGTGGLMRGVTPQAPDTTVEDLMKGWQTL